MVRGIHGKSPTHATTHTHHHAPVAKSLSAGSEKVSNFMEKRGTDLLGAGKVPTISDRPPSGSGRVSQAAGRKFI